MNSKCQHSLAVRSFVETIRQLYGLWPCLDCRDKTFKRDMYKSGESGVKAVVAIRIVDTDLNGTFGVDSATGVI